MYLFFLLIGVGWQYVTGSLPDIAQVMQFAADGVFGEAKFVADVLGDDLTILFELF